MSEQTGQFRSAAFGGFHRQDVLDYLEKLTTEKRDLASQLEVESERRSQAEERFSQAEEEVRTLREAQEAVSGELDYLRSELEARSDSLSHAEEEIRVLRAQVDALRPGAESWEHIKEQAGLIEINAHERAQVTIRDAHARASDIQADGKRWVEGIRSGCDKLSADLNAAIQSAETQLDAARSAFRRAEEEMEGYRDSLSRLVSAAEQEVVHPLEESTQEKTE